MAVMLKPKPLFCTKNETLTSGVLKQDYSKPIVSRFEHYSYDNLLVRLVVETNTLEVDIPSDAALGFGEHLWTYPECVFQPISTTMLMSSLAPTGLSATAGEIGMGTLIASGANATLGAVGATAENIAEGVTIADHVAATALVSYNNAPPVAAFNAGAGSVSSGVNIGAGGAIDATAGTTKAHFNVASTWNQTSAENIAFSVKIVHTFLILANDGFVG
jgi:hypothetical protein